MSIYDIGIVKSFKDLINFFRFKRDIKKEFYTRDSKFNEYKLQRNWLGNVVYMQLNCTDEDLMNFNYDPEKMVYTKIKPAVEYLSRELEWGDYLVPQISNFVDDEGTPSLSYGILFVFTPYHLTFFRLLCMLVIGLGIIGAGVWALMNYVV